MLAGGGYFKIINASIPPATLARLGYTPGADRRHRPLLAPCVSTLKGCPHVNEASLRAKGDAGGGAGADRGPACRRLLSWGLGVRPLADQDDVLTEVLGFKKEQVEARV
ncbi:MAG: hypothetical protein U0736_01885 [Gemmataceae bacterium]